MSEAATILSPDREVLLSAPKITDASEPQNLFNQREQPSPPAVIETPVNEYGLIDLGQLVMKVVELAPGGHVWGDQPDNHHAYWYERLYRKNHLARDFRNLPINRLHIPIDLHIFIHKATEPIDPPDVDVMEYCIEGWQAAESIHAALKILETNRYGDGSLISEDKAYWVFKEQRSVIRKLLKRVKYVPPEFLGFQRDVIKPILSAKGLMGYADKAPELLEAYAHLSWVGEIRKPWDVNGKEELASAA